MDDALPLLRAELEVTGATADLGAEEAWLAFVRFGRMRFRTPDTFDADGLLFQYGTHTFDGPATFLLDFTRQFVVTDADGNHNHYVQVHCELRYSAVSALHDLGSFASWFFHDGEDDLDRWSTAMSSRAAEGALREFKPTGLRVYREQV
ncbi:MULTISPECIES: hypothetical protein [unclassified Streptomyces]|uniref:hypothetical protein n=1 Tax=unclassified Streptomyces TaxID=2593676 RepID=UPI000B88AAF3|nr:MULTISPECIES: hypothetical protein [unclassified Streptomyces]MYS19889.1 hypothetical protein [Streptomyces sp. SID4948]